MMTNIFRGKGLRIKLASPEDFLKIKETLTRIGVASKSGNILYQSCHILHKRGEYAILHFKELFELDGKKSTISKEDLMRRNTIVDLLEEWKLLTIVEEDVPKDTSEYLSMSKIKIVPHSEKSSWELVPKYAVGVKKAQ